VPTSVAYSTVKAAGLLAARAATTGAISVKVAALTEGVMIAMLLTKLKSVMAVTVGITDRRDRPHGQAWHPKIGPPLPQ
jgi:hypothetical protein